MPLVWKLDPPNNLLVAVADGDVTRLEIDRYLDAIIQNEALTYRKVFDVHRGDMSMTAEDVLPLAIRMRSLHGLGPMGPLAVILPPGRGKRLQRALGMLAVAERPMRVFENPLVAYRWIAKQDVPGVAEDRDEAKGTLEWSAKARELAARVRYLARAAGQDANKLHLGALPGEILYRGEADITHRGMPINICVKQVGQSWEFQCCRADRMALGTLLTLDAEEITASRAQGQNPLETTLDRIKGLVRAGLLAIPDSPGGGAY
jgi:hypothetical protein